MSDNNTDWARANSDCPACLCDNRGIRAFTEDRIIAMEWAFFQMVHNVGGRANCQDMPETFGIMRKSQFTIWTDDMLLSYYEDLKAAEYEGRNPMTEKYGYMMESTHPDEFALIKDALPTIPQAKRRLIEQIIAIQIPWAESMSGSYPRLAGRGRVIRTSQDSPGTTSIETYSRGELATYSERTLELMLEHFENAQALGHNLQEDVYASIARSYGYQSLADAEASLA